MTWVAVAIGGSAVIGAISQSNASKSAADAQTGASNRASQTQMDMYNQTRQDQQPWMDAGKTALGQMQDPSFQKSFTSADFQADPGYQFRMSEGQKAIERSAAARGGLNSGATMKALTNYAQGAGAQEYQSAYDRFNNDATTRYNRLASVAGLGQTATNQSGANGMNTANQVGQNTIGAGNAAAAGQIGQANALNGAIGNGMNSWMNYSLMNKAFPTPTQTNPWAGS